MGELTRAPSGTSGGGERGSGRSLIGHDVSSPVESSLRMVAGGRRSRRWSATVARSWPSGNRAPPGQRGKGDAVVLSWERTTSIPPREAPPAARILGRCRVARRPDPRASRGRRASCPSSAPAKTEERSGCQHRQRLCADGQFSRPNSDCSAVRNTHAIRSRGELQGWRVMRHPKRKMTHPDLRMWALVTGVAEALKRRARAYRATQRDIPSALSEAARASRPPPTRASRRTDTTSRPFLLRLKVPDTSSVTNVPHDGHQIRSQRRA